MASKKPSSFDDNWDDLFDGIGDDAKTKKPATGTTAAAAATNTAPTAAVKPVKPVQATSKPPAGNDILADLESQLASEQPSSRPHTPRLKEAAAGVRRPAGTPPASDDKAAAAAAARKSTDSARSLRASFTPSATSSELHEVERKGNPQSSPPQPQHHDHDHDHDHHQQQQSGGGWWGGILSTASAAMKQAEAAYKDIQQNEEAKKWTDQVKGLRAGIDVGTLRSYGDELRNRAMPTFTNILHTLAPPISSHERLLIHITHDLVGYPSLDPLIHSVFARVMSQVEGGDLMVVQRGHENSTRRNSDGSAGWRDGPWWRQTDAPRELGSIKGMVEGTKLCRAGADSYASEYFASHGGIEQAKERATSDLSESNPVRTSDLFLSVQAIIIDADKTLFAGTASAEKDKASSAVQDQVASDDEQICFAVYVLDPVHEIEFSTVSQAMPSRWARWLDAATPLTPRSGDDSAVQDFDSGVPDDIREILDSGGVDPREWVAEWIEDTLNLSVGVVAQRYVAHRMGVGEGGLGRGKKRADEIVDVNAGEAARAGVI